VLLPGMAFPWRKLRWEACARSDAGGQGHPHERGALRPGRGAVGGAAGGAAVRPQVLRRGRAGRCAPRRRVPQQGASGLQVLGGDTGDARSGAKLNRACARLFTVLMRTWVAFLQGRGGRRWV